MNLPIWSPGGSRGGHARSPRLNELTPFLRPFNNVLRQTATKANREAFEGFVAFLSDNGNRSTAELIDAIGSIEPPPKKAARSTTAKAPSAADEQTIERYTDRLVAVRSDYEAFKPVFAELKNDKSIKSAAQKAIAAAFVPGGRKYKSGKEALEAMDDYARNLARSRGALERNAQTKF